MIRLPRILRNFNLFVDGIGYAGLVEQATPPKLAINEVDHQAGGMIAPIGLDMGLQKLELSMIITDYDEAIMRQFGLPDAGGMPMRLKGSIEGDNIGQSQIPIDIECRGRMKELDFG
ncbi:phage major tail tube protein, partial [Gammaproteobacteria bacterium AH-315-C21]|nr:phage major tail tube protein [Gammaproteobacteria bacterium AH-315-C21]